MKTLVAQSCPAVCDPVDYTTRLLSMRFSRQEHWSGLIFSCPADLPNPRTEPRLLHCRQNLYHLNHQGINGQSWNLQSIWSLAGWSYDIDILEVIRYMIPLPQATFLGGSDGKESACNARKLGSIPGLERSPGGGHGNPLQYSCLENPHGQRSLVNYIPWGCKELFTSEQLNTKGHI